MYGLILISNGISNRYQLLENAFDNLAKSINNEWVDGIYLTTNLTDIHPSIDGPARCIMVDDIHGNEFAEIDRLLSATDAPRELLNGVQFKKITGTGSVDYGALNIYQEDDILAITKDFGEIGVAHHDMSSQPHMIQFGVGVFTLNTTPLILTAETIGVLMSNPKLRTPKGIDELIAQGVKGECVGMYSAAQYGNKGIVLHSISPVFLAQWLKTSNRIVNYKSTILTNQFILKDITRYQRLTVEMGWGLLPMTAAGAEALELDQNDLNYPLVVPFDYSSYLPQRVLPIAQFNLAFSMGVAPKTILHALEM